MKTIKLTRGQEALVDDEDYESVNCLKWYAQKHLRGFYAKRRDPNRPRQLIEMGRYILQAPKDLVVDHINGNPLDNQKANLRVATRAENTRNRARAHQKKLPKGVFQGRWGRPFAVIVCQGVRYELGHFDTVAEAHQAYSQKARELHGEFACTERS